MPGRCSTRCRCLMNIAGPEFPPSIAALGGTARSATPAARCARTRWIRFSRRHCSPWRQSLAYDGERVDTAVLDQLETTLRHVQEELAAWRARALKAEADLKEHPAPARGAAL